MVLEKLTDQAKQALVSAQKESQKLGLKKVGVPLVFKSIISVGDSAAAEVIRSAGITGKDIEKISNSDLKQISSTKLLEKAFSNAKQLTHSFVGTGHLLLALFDLEKSPLKDLFEKSGLSKESVLAEFKKREDERAKRSRQGRGGNNRQADKMLVDSFDLDLTEKARSGTLGPVVDREKEVEKLAEVLLRKRKNNPLLIGEQGVGRASIVRGLAKKISESDVASPLLRRRIIHIDSSLLSYGPMVLPKLLKELGSDEETILFIEDMHGLFGPSGMSFGLGSPVTGLLRSRLEKGSLRIIGSTTPEEYSNLASDNDPLIAHFEPVKVEEPDSALALQILQTLSTDYEKHHQVKFDPQALEQAVYLSERFINEGSLPEKALELLDQAASAVRAKSGHPPKELGRVWQSLRKIKKEKEKLVSEGSLDKAEKLRLEEAELNNKYEQLSEKAAEVTDVVEVSRDAVAEVVAEKTGIPVSALSPTEAEKLLNMEEKIKQRIIGQERAVSSLAKALRRARTGLSSPNRPIGTFLFLGPTGVGKTETAKALTQFLFGDEGKLMRLDMSDFMEKHNVSRLIGAPPGYVGYFEGGELTEKIRQNPYTVVLFDEIEKAHPDVLDILLQISEEGELKDARSRLTDFKNTIIILTSNIGADMIKKGKLGFNVSSGEEEKAEEDLEYSQMEERLLAQLKKKLKPEFLNRLDEIVVFRSLNEDDILEISDLHIDEVRKRLERKNISLKVTKTAKKILAKEGYSEEYGARPLRRTVEDKIANPISEMILRKGVSEGNEVKVRGRDGKLVFETK